MSYTMISHVRDNKGKNIIKFNLVDLKGIKLAGNYDEVKDLIERHGTAYVDNLGLKDGQIVGINGHLDRYPYACENGKLVNGDRITVLAKMNEEFICSDSNGDLKKVTKANLIRLARNGVVTNAALCNGGIRSINGSFMELDIAKKTKPATIEDKLKQADKIVQSSKYKFPLDRLKEELRKMTEIYIGEINTELAYYLRETLGIQGKDGIVYESNIFINTFEEDPSDNVYSEKGLKPSNILYADKNKTYGNQSDFDINLNDWIKKLYKDELYVPAITLYMYANRHDEDGPDAELDGEILDEDAWITFCKCDTVGAVKMVFDDKTEMEKAYKTAALQYVEAFRIAATKIAKAAKDDEMLNRISKIPVNNKISKIFDTM